MRCRKNTGRVLAGILAVGLMVSSVQSTVYAVENENGTVVVAEQEEPVLEENGKESTGTESAGAEESNAGKENAAQPEEGKEGAEDEQGKTDDESGEETADTIDTTPKKEDKGDQERIETDSNQPEEDDKAGDAGETETAEESNAKAAAAEVMEADEAETSGSCGENLTWKFEDGVLTISGTGAMKDYTDNSFSTPWYSIRSKINKVIFYNGVTSVGKHAFWDCKNLTSIIIPDSVTSIGDSAFSFCSSLTSITIPNSVTSIGFAAFRRCSNLSSIVIPDSVTYIGEYAFEKCVNLTSAGPIGGNYALQFGYIDKIPDNLCADTGIESVVLPDSITEIGIRAFRRCSNLRSVVIPDGVTSIGGGAFEDCSSLTHVVVPDSVVNISGAFHGCISLTSAGPIGGDYAFQFGYTDKIPRGFFAGTGIKGVTLPDNLTSIEDSTFYGCYSLTSVTLPDGLTFIGNSAFRGCYSLTSIIIPESVEYMSFDVFNGCTSLTSAGPIGGDYNIQFGWTSQIPPCAFHRSWIARVVIPDSVTTIGINAFTDCKALESIIIPEGAFVEGDPSGNDWGIFNGCVKLLNAGPIGGDYNIQFGWSNKIPERAFYGSDVVSVTIPDGVTEICSSAFRGCSGLTNIELPDSVIEIEGGAFKGCTSLTHIELPDSLIRISDYAFQDCISLTNVVIPDKVTSLGGDVFSGCINLINVIIPGSVENNYGWTKGLFSGCTNLTNAGPIGRNYNIQFGWTSKIPSCAFYGSDITKITIPKGIVRIQSEAFQNCSKLTDVYYGGTENDWKAINIDSDNDCLTNATIHYATADPELPDEIISGILRSGSDWKIRWKLTCQSDSNGNPKNGRIEISVNSTNTVEELYLYNETGEAFPWELAPYNIPKAAIRTLIICGKPTKKLRIPTNAFKGYSGLNTIVFEYVSGIDSYAFEDCVSLQTVDFLNGGTDFFTIGEGAFKNCTHLTKMDFPASLKYIGAEAFQSTALGTITLGSDVMEIGDNVFSGCDKLLIRCFENSVAHRYAQKNNIPFQLITETDNSIYIYYGGDKPEKFDHNLDYYVSMTDSTTYSPQLSHMLIAMSCAAYDEGNVKASMKELGFKDNDIACHYNKGDWDSLISYAFGKKIMPNGETLVLVTVRGSSSSFDWLSNCNVGVGSWHMGFEAAVNEVYASLTNFMGGNLNGTTYVVTGHSRGAAVANLLEIKLFEAKVASKKVYGYNFACPDVARAVPTMWNWLGEHDNMFNIGNAPDPVTMVPGVLGGSVGFIPGTTWGKFGQSRWFSEDWYNINEIALNFAKHDQKVYLKHLRGVPSFDSFKTYEQRRTMMTIPGRIVGRMFNIHCPVDVIITDQNRNTVASVIGGEANYYGSSFGKVMIFTDGDKKAIFVQGNEPLEIHLTATDGGTMTYTVQTFDYDLGEVLSEKVFNNVALMDGKQMLSIVDTQEAAGNGTDVSQVQLLVLDEDGNTVKEVLPDGNGTEIPYTGPNEILPDDLPTDGKIPEGLWIAGVKDAYTYTGTAIKPEIRVYDGKTRLQPGQDYTASYKNNTKANNAAKISTAPTITVKGKGNYAGSETTTFQITAVDLSDSAVLTEDITAAYNKKIQKKVPIVTYNGKKLSANRDFTVSYPNGGDGAYKEVGVYDILLTAKSGGNFTGTRTVKCTITDNILLGKVSVKKIPAQAYTGEAIEPELTVSFKGAPLVKDTDYSVSFSDNTEIGTAKAILTGIGKYAGTKSVTFSITGTSLKGASVSGIENKIYNGCDQKQTFTVTLKGKVLTEGTDYDVSYEKNKNAGKASAAIKGKGAYTGTIRKTFAVEKFNIAANADGRFEVKLEQDVVPYAKGGAKPEVTVRFKTGDEKWETLAEGKDYMLSYRNYTAVNDGSNQNKQPVVTVKGKGSFSGTYGTALTYKIVAQDLGQLRLTAQDKTYQNKKNVYATKITITDLDGKTLKPGTDYNKALTYSYANETTVNTAGNGTIVRAAGVLVDKNDVIPAGTILKVQAEAKSGGNYAGTLTGEYRIVQAAISSASVSVPKQIYTGRAIALEKNRITVRIKGKQLDESQYEIVPDSYKNNVKKGTATVTIRGVDNYGGTKDVKFTIKAKGFLWWWR